MIHHIIIAAALTCLVWSAALPKKKEDEEVKTPQQYKELIAEHFLKQLSKLDDEEKAKLKTVAKNVLVWMLFKPRTKLSRGEIARKMLEKKVAALGDEARKFVTQRLEEAYKLHKAVMAGEKPKPEEMKLWAENTISNYKELSEDAKKDIAKQFPIAHALAKNEKLRAIVKAYLALRFAPKKKEVKGEKEEVVVPKTKDIKEEKEVATPEQYKKLFAVHVLKHLAKLTPEEKEKLKEVAKKALIWMLAKSKAKLSDKGEVARKILEKKVTALGDEAKKFVTQRLEEAYKFHKAVMAGEKPKPEEMKKWAESTISSYKALSEEAKKDIAKQFPVAHALTKSEKLREIVKALLAKKIAEKKAAAEAKKA